MSLSLNNSKDIICDRIWFLYQNNLESLEDVITSMGGGGSSGETALTGSGSAIVTGSGLSRNISVDLTAYSTTTYIDSLLSGKISTTHESYKVGSNNVDSCVYNSTMGTMTLENSSGATAVLSVDLGGNLNKGADGVITIPILDAWDYTTLKIKCSGETVRNPTSSLAGDFVWNTSQLTIINDLNNYTPQQH